MQKEELIKVLGELVVELRKPTKLSQEKFALECNMDRSHVSLIERGKRMMSIYSLFKLAHGLDIPASEFMKLLEEKLRENNIDPASFE